MVKSGKLCLLSNFLSHQKKIRLTIQFNSVRLLHLLILIYLSFASIQILINIYFIYSVLVCRDFTKKKYISCCYQLTKSVPNTNFKKTKAKIWKSIDQLIVNYCTFHGTIDFLANLVLKVQQICCFCCLILSVMNFFFITVVIEIVVIFAKPKSLIIILMSYIP